MTDLVCHHEGCSARPTLRFVWPWGVPAASCGEHSYVPGQVAANMNQQAPALIPIEPDNPSVRAHALLDKAEDAFRVMRNLLMVFDDAIEQLDIAFPTPVPVIEHTPTAPDSANPMLALIQTPNVEQTPGAPPGPSEHTQDTPALTPDQPA